MCIPLALLCLTFAAILIDTVLSFYIGPPVEFGEDELYSYALFNLATGFITIFGIICIFLCIAAAVGFILICIALFKQKRTKHIKLSLIFSLVISASICAFGLVFFLTEMQNLIYSGMSSGVLFALILSILPFLLGLPSLILCAIAVQQRVWLPPFNPNEFYNGFNSIT